MAQRGWRRCVAGIGLWALLTGLWTSSVAGQTAPGRSVPTPTASVTPLPTATPSPTDTPYTFCAPGRTSCLVLYATSTPAATVTGNTAGAGASNAAGCELWDVGSWGSCIATAFLNNLAGAVQDLNNTIGAADIWTNTDPSLTFANPVVARYWDGVRTLADAFIFFIFLGLCGEILAAAAAQRTYAGALERFWRLILAALLANGSLPVLGTAIALANAATDGASGLQSGQLFAVSAHSGALNGAILGALLSLVDGVMELLLAIQMIIRVGLLDGLLILAPAGLLCYAWPRLQGMAELWSRLFVVALITQFVQIVILHMGEDLVLYAPLVFGKDGTTIAGETSLGNMLTWAQYLVALGVFVVVLRVPRLLRGYTGTPLAVSLLALRSVTSLVMKGGTGG